MKSSTAQHTRHRAVKQSSKKSIKASRPIHKKVLLSPAALFLLLCLGVMLITSTISTSAQSFSVSAVVPAEPLTSSATISSLSDGQTVTTAPITVEGNCPNNSYVTLKRNGYSSGTALCVNNHYSIQTDLSPGNNSLVAQDYNVLDQPGPASTAVNIIYVVSESSSQSTDNQVSQAANLPNATTGADNSSGLGPLLLSANYNYKTFTTTDTYNWQVNLSGGTPPYVVYVNWGDSTTSSLFFKTDPTFYLQHNYSKTGVYNIIVSCVDAEGARVVTQLSSAIKVAGTKNTGLTGLTGSTGSPSIIDKVGVLKAAHNLLWLIWPSYIILILMTVSFWLGERKELQTVMSKYELKHRKRLAHR